MSVRVETAGGHAAHGEHAKQTRESLAPIIRQSAMPALVREVLPGSSSTASCGSHCTRALFTAR
jgi:uncharacterized membrane protein YdbT with pleckstrin-like domain